MHEMNIFGVAGITGGLFKTSWEDIWWCVASVKATPYDPAVTMKGTDPFYIKFINPLGDNHNWIFYTSFIAAECALQKIDICTREHGWLARKSAWVYWNQMASEGLSFSCKWEESLKDGTMLIYNVDLLIPCILYLENYFGENCFPPLSTEVRVMSRIHCKLSCIDAWHDPKWSSFVTRLVYITMETANWKVKWWACISWEDNGFKFLFIVKVMMLGINKIIEAVILDDQNELCGKLIVAVSAYKVAIKLLMLHCPLMDGEIQQFADKVNKFYKTWTFIFGLEG